MTYSSKYFYNKVLKVQILRQHYATGMDVTSVSCGESQVKFETFIKFSPIKGSQGWIQACTGMVSVRGFHASTSAWTKHVKCYPKQTCAFHSSEEKSTFNSMPCMGETIITIK